MTENAHIARAKGGELLPHQSTHANAAKGRVDGSPSILAGESRRYPASIARADASAYYNAIVPQDAQAFIESYCEARGLIALEAAA